MWYWKCNKRIVMISVVANICNDYLIYIYTAYLSILYKKLQSTNLKTLM